jgi:hypothetical protein
MNGSTREDREFRSVDILYVLDLAEIEKSSCIWKGNKRADSNTDMNKER